MSEAHATKRARQVLLLSVLVTVALYAVPYGQYVAYPLLLLSTYAHEMGHGLAGLLVGASFESFAIYADGSGVARVAGSMGRLAAAWVSAGGLIGPPVLAGVFFSVLSKQGLARGALLVFGATALLACALVVRNLFGWLFVGTVGLGCVFIALRTSALFAQWALALLAVQLALSAFSRSDYLFTKVARTAHGDVPSDVTAMSNALFLPYWFWGVLCGAVSVLVLGFGLRTFWRATRSAADRAAC